MTLWTLKMAWRDSRRHRGRLALYTTSVSIGIAALVTLQSLAEILKNQVDVQASALLGADLQLSTKQPFDTDIESHIRALNAEIAEQIRLTSMIFLPRGSHSRLAEIRALSEGYPFYGNIETVPTSASKTFHTGKMALVDENIMLQFKASVGDSIKIGNIFYKIEGKILKIPGETSLRSDIQPRVYIPRAHLDSMFLLQRGSRVEHSRFIKFDQQAEIGQIKSELKTIFSNRNVDIDITTIDDRKRQIGRSLINLNRFLNLGGFVALLLGAIGVGSAIRSYILQKLDTIAILRGLGATLRQAFTIYLIQALAMGLWGSLLGTLLGTSVLYFSPLIFGTILPVDIVIDFNFFPILQAVSIGLGISLVFTIRPLLSIRQSSPLRALRSAYEGNRTLKDRLINIAGNLLLVLVTLFFAYHITSRWDYAISFTLGVTVAFLCLIGVAHLLTWSARRFFPISWSYEFRQSIANLFRPNNQTIMLLLGLGLGTFLVSTLYLSQNSLILQIQNIGSENRPNAVLFDVQSDQVTPLKSTLALLNLPVIQNVPIVTMRIHSVKNKLIKDFRKSKSQDLRRGNWAFTREYRCTYRDSLSSSESLVAGTWRGKREGDSVSVSLEERIANNLGVTVGDSIVFDIQGIQVPVTVGSIRKVEWQRIMPNFFVVFPKGVLETAPQFHVIVTRYTTNVQLAELQRQSIEIFPNVSIIDLDLVLSTIDTILEKVAVIIQFLALFSLFTGIIVLVGIIAGSRYQRIQECTLLRTIGARKSQIRRIMLLEYIFLGTLAAITGLTLSIGSAWGLSYFIFDVPFKTDILPLILTIPAIGMLTTIVGLISARNVASSPPIEILRNI